MKKKGRKNKKSQRLFVDTFSSYPIAVFSVFARLAKPVAGNAFNAHFCVILLMLRLLLLLSSGRVYLLSEANATAVLRIAQKNVMVHLSHGVETACFSRGFKSFLVLFPILLSVCILLYQINVLVQIAEF